jgi:glycosyltransferase involved in cell wall biosynthesis
MKLLISAFACHPKMGSEDGVGWGWVTGLAAHHQVHVIARESRRVDIEAALADHPVENLHFHFVDPPHWLIFWKKGARNFMAYAALWQISAFGKALSVVRREKFDIVQHLTYGNLWLPSLFFLLPGSYLWGPVGGELVPPAFSRGYGWRARLVEMARCLIQRYLCRLNVPILLGMSRARLILVRTEETRAFLPKWAQKKAVLLPETALELERFPFDPSQRSDLSRRQILTVVYAGRIILWKNLHLAIKAFVKLLRDNPELLGRVRFEIYGDGPFLPHCRELAGDDAGRSIFFHGFIDRATLLDRLQDAHLFVHLGVKDTAATAPMEAMALGLPVICLNCGGMANLVTEGCGVLLEASTPEVVVAEVAERLHEFALDRQRLLTLSLAARERVVRSFAWQRRVEQYNDILQKELGPIGKDTGR